VKILLIMMVLLLAGCAQYRAAIGSYGAEASDASLHDALWTVCKAIPVGAVKRKFDTPKRMSVYAELCGDVELVP
tara:strand:- start:3849 stop:4073 length:225 start_codon:yes stop_codon:yes gene_type:complete